MLTWSLAFFILAIVAGIFGFSGIAAGATEIAQLLFVFFIVVFLASLVWSLITGRKPPPPL